MNRINTASIRTVAWDFDGVLNRNVENGTFAWSKTFERDLGLPILSFTRFLFGGRFQKAMIGEDCLIEIVTDWSEQNGAHGRAREILDYWFRMDDLPDAETLAIVAALKSRGIGNVMATNNEVQRAAFIEHDMGFGTHMDRIFAAGRMRIAKPDGAYFEHIETALETGPAHLLLVDDLAENVEAARARGWQAFLFTNGAHAGLAASLGLASSAG